MAILAGFMVPHPPMIVPDVGRGSESQIKETIKAYEQVADEIAALEPETIIITSPHSIMYADYFCYVNQIFNPVLFITQLHFTSPCLQNYTFCV